jgi:hypothetical protein
MEYNVKILFFSGDSWENRILLINEKENKFQIKKELKTDNKQIKTYSLLNASLIKNQKENSIFIGAPSYSMTIKPNNEEDNKYIIKSFEKILNNINEKNIIEEKKEEEEKEDSNKCFENLNKKLINLKNNFNALIKFMEEKKVMENPEMKNKIDDFENILNGTIIKCYKYHELVSDLEYDNLIFGDDTAMSTIEISRNLNNFSRLYAFKNRPNDISFKKQKTIYQSAIIKHSNTVEHSKISEIANSTIKSNQILPENTNINSFNEFQCKDYLPSKFRKSLKTPLKFPPNLVKEMVTNFTQNKTALPVYFNEPLSMLQKQCEKFYYLDLLNKASEEPKPEMRLCYIAAFIIGEIFLNNGRTLKPFNPIIGETYEYFINDKNFRYYAEQVSHKPPVTAYVGENPNFELYGDTLGNTSFKFFRGCMELSFKNKVHIKLKKLGEHYTYIPPNALAKGIINPPLYVDYSGDILIQNLNEKKYKCELKFIAEGWTKDSLGNFEGTVYNDNKIVYLLGGNWKKNIYMTDPDGNDKKDLLVLDQNLEYLKNNSEKYILPEFVSDLNNLTEELENSLPKNDCRFKKDQRFLEEGNTDEAQIYKEKYEEKQRKELNNDEHKILFFNKKYDEEIEDNYYEPNGQYWEMKKNDTLKNNCNCNIFDVTNY